MPVRLFIAICLAGWAALAAAADPSATDAAGDRGAPQADAATPATPDAGADTANPPAAADAPATGAPAGASDSLLVTDREAEIGKRLSRLTDGDELQWLEADGARFFAFRRKPRKGPPRGALLIVPAPGDSIDDGELVRTLRTLPPAGGFVTLAMQTPLNPAVPAATDSIAGTAKAEVGQADDPKPDDVATAAVAAESPTPATPGAFCPRLAAALTALEAEQAPLLAIAAAGASVPAVLDCYPEGLPASVRAVAAIGPWDGSFDRIRVPTLEVVPTREPAAVRAADRRAAQPLEDDAPPRRRADLDGVDRRYVGAGIEVAKRLRGWLEHLPPPTAAPTAASPASP